MISLYTLLRQRLLYPLVLMLFFTSLLIGSLSFATRQLSAAEDENTGTTFDIVGKSPAPSALNGVTLSTTVEATFNDDANESTLPGNLLVLSDQQGRVNGGISYAGGTQTATFTPNRRFHFGESVTVIATAGIENIAGDPLTPTQWRFTPGLIDTTRCVEGFLAYEDDFVPVWASATDWGDYDGDGDLDAVVAGKTVGNPATFIYRNEGISDDTGMSAFTRLNAGLANVRDASVEWGDSDNDGDLDILLTGTDVFGQKISHVYRNNGNGTFTNVNANLTPVSLGGATWIDYNTDGRLDIFLHGDSNGGRLARLYRNDGGNTFTELPLTLPGVNNSSADWADYDNDGDFDLLLTGDGLSGFVTAIYNNDNGTFVDVNAGLPGVRDSSVAWGDYNGDGFEDILLSGETSAGASAPVTRIYRNNGNGTFTDINAGLTGILDGSVAWGDFDNDGDLDVLVGGKDAAEEVSTTLYENRSGVFVVFPTNLPAISLGSLTFGDADGDFDADILLTGLTDTSIVAGVFRNYDCPADVAISQTMVPTYTTTSEPVTITLSFTNLGPVTATHVVIEDIIPTALTNLQVVSSTTAGHVRITDSGATPGYRWNVSNLNLGDGGIITVTGILFPQFGQIYTNTARIRAAEDVTMTNNVARERITVPLQIVQTTPGTTEKIGVPLDQQIRMVFDANIDMETADDESLRLYGSHSGYLGQINTTYSAGSQAYRFNAHRPFGHGETVTVIASAQINSPAGAPLLPYQWQFVAGETSNRCVGDFVRHHTGGTGLPGVEHGVVAWGDYDNDGDPDLLLVGQSSQGIISRLYRNDGGLFTDIGAPLTGVRDGSAHWIDDDGDGDLDVFLTGTNGSNPVAQLYRNTNGSFAAVGTGITPVTNSAAAWGDYNNDGYLDLLLSGRSAGGLVTRLYKNNGNGTFVDVNIGLPGLEQGAVAWADYDDDHDLDLLLTGNNGSGSFAAIYRNESNIFTGDRFTDSGISLTPVERGAVAWADYDDDGDLDLLLTGAGAGGAVTELYQNSAGNLATVPTTLPAMSNGSVAWGDYDNDGILDLLLAGLTAGGRVATIYHQQGGVFDPYPVSLMGVNNSTVAWGDVDRDEDLDLILMGDTGSGLTTQLYRNTDCISDVGITKTVTPTVAVAGDVVTYTITFSNAGPQPAFDVQISDVIPDDLTNVQVMSATIGAGVVITETGNAGIKQWQVSELAVGEGGIFTLTADVVAGAPGVVFDNVVTIFATHDITLTNNTARVGVGRPFHITATLPNQAESAFPVAGVISATFDASVNPDSATSQTVTIYGAQSGLRSATVGYDAFRQTLQLTPTVPLHHGEAVNVIGTAALRSTAPALSMALYRRHPRSGALSGRFRRTYDTHSCVGQEQRCLGRL